MFKIAKGWYQLVDGCFLIVTGFTMLDAGLTAFTYSFKDLFTVDKIGSLVVSIVVCCFWIGRFIIIRNRNKKEDYLLDLEIKIKEMQYNRKDIEGETDIFLKNDKHNV